VLDPYVRLQCGVDENHATEEAAILGSLRALSRTENVAIALVHHTRKGGAADPGQSLRGSGDFHAWGDSNLYLRSCRGSITLVIEQRAAPAPPAVMLELVSDGGPVRLEVRQLPPPPPPRTLAERILHALEESQPLHKHQLRHRLRVRNHGLAETLRDLEAAGTIARTPSGWTRSPSPSP